MTKLKDEEVIVKEMTFEKVRELFLKGLKDKKCDMTFCRDGADNEGPYRIMGFNDGDNVMHVFSFYMRASDILDCVYSYQRSLLSNIKHKEFKANKNELLAFYDEVERLTKNK